MYVSTTTAKGITYVKLYRSVWSKAKQRSVTEVVKSFGRLDDLTRDNPNAYEELRAKYKRQRKAVTAKRKMRKKREAEDDINSKEETKDDYRDLNFSTYPIGRIWSELGLDYKVAKIMERGKLKFDVGRTIQHTMCARIVNPQSHHFNWSNQHEWLGTMANPVELQHFYRSLDFLETNRDELMAWINGKLSEKGRDLSIVYFDCTNTYFETPYDDNEWECIRTARQLGITSVEAKLEGIVDGDALRMRGMSKERRYDMPLIAVALVVDNDGIPLDFRVYAGNKSEKTEMMETIKRLREVYGINRCIVVADRGLNTLENLIGLEEENLQFMVAQSIAQLPEKVRNDICSLDGWSSVKGDTVRYKEIQLTKKSQSTGEKRTYRLVVSLCPSRLARDKNEIELAWEMAKQAVAEGRVLEHKRPAWAKFAKFESEPVDKNDKAKKKNLKKAVELDTDAFRKALAIAGMYGIVTNIPAKTVGEPNGMTAEEIFSKHAELVQIEDCFKVMKDTLELRPVNVRNKRRIRGHVMLCVMALIFIRLLARKLKEAGTPLSTYEISNALKKATVRTGGEMGKKTFRPVRVKMAKHRSKNLRFKGDDEADPVDLIMKVTGLMPIELECDRHGLARYLRTKFPTDADVLGYGS